jgi:hypothetical protein
MPMLIAMRSLDGRRVPQMMKWGQMARPGAGRRGFELHRPDLRAEQCDGRNPQPRAGHCRRGRLVEMARRRTGHRTGIARVAAAVR